MVLVAGGHDSSGNISASAELYDPASGTWTATGSLNTARDAAHGDLAAQRDGAGCRGTDSGSMFPRARNCTTRPAGPGRPRAASTPRALSHTATLLPNGMVLVAGGLIAAALPRARNCTTRRAGPGRPPAASTPRVMITRRPCCPTGWCWLQGDLIATAIFP